MSSRMLHCHPLLEFDKLHCGAILGIGIGYKTGYATL